MTLDEMKLKLSTKFMKSLVAKMISKAIFKKFEFKPELQINELNVELINNKVYLHVNADATVDDKSFMKISQIIDPE